MFANQISYALSFTCVLLAFTRIPSPGAEPTTPANSAASERATWPQWRGPTRDGRLAAAVTWPTTLSGDALRTSWRVPLGPSYSGPIVSASRVFVTETINESREVVRALDRTTGERRWEASWEGALSVPFFAKANGDWIRSTPAYDGESLFVAGMRDLLVCLNAETGDIRWKVDFASEFSTPVPDFGFVCSPLVEGEFVYAQAGASFCKLDKRTGKVAWRVLQDQGGTFGGAFSSPRIETLNGERQMLVQTREKLAGLNPETGDVLWSKPIAAFRGMNILTPTVIGDAVFTSAYGGKSLLIAPTTEAGTISVKEAWTNKATGYMSSPVVIDGHIYMHLQNERLTCLDASSGATLWTTPPMGKYWSIVANGSLFLGLNDRGELHLVQANPSKYEPIDRRALCEDSTWAHLAVCDDEIFVRELNAMVAYRWSRPDGTRPAK